MYVYLYGKWTYSVLLNRKYFSQQIDCMEAALKLPETNNHPTRTRTGRAARYTSTR